MNGTWISFLFILTMGVIGLMAYLGLDELFGIHRDGWRRFLSGGLTLSWGLLAAYLLIWTWIPSSTRDGVSLLYINLMSVAGYGIAKVLDFLLLPLEDREAWDEPYITTAED
jgi:hypothetical protein